MARSSERSGALAKRYGVSAEIIRKWRKRGAPEYQDRSPTLIAYPWKATEEERAVVCAVRKSRNFPLDDLTLVRVAASQAFKLVAIHDFSTADRSRVKRRISTSSTLRRRHRSPKRNCRRHSR